MPLLLAHSAAPAQGDVSPGSSDDAGSERRNRTV